METLKYTVIKNSQQYMKYCNILEELVIQDDSQNTEEIELVTLLIDKWDSENNTFDDSDPIELLKSLMREHDRNNFV